MMIKICKNNRNVRLMRTKYMLRSHRSHISINYKFKYKKFDINFKVKNEKILYLNVIEIRRTKNSRREL